MPTRFGHDVVGQVIGLSYTGIGAKAIANRLRDRGIAISASTVWRMLKRGVENLAEGNHPPTKALTDE